MITVFIQFAVFVFSWLVAFGALCVMACATKSAVKLAHEGFLKLLPTARVSLNTYCRNGARLRVYSL